MSGEVTEVTERDGQIHRTLREMEKAGHDEPAVSDPHPDRTKESVRPNFFRMRVSGNGESAQQARALAGTLKIRLVREFPEAHDLMRDIYLLVREVEDDENGEIKVDAYGMPIWKTDDQGRLVEDWKKLTIRDREHFLFSIVTGLYEWRLRAAGAWSSSMFLKGQWEMSFAHGFDEPEGRLTVDDRTQKAVLASGQDRFNALFEAAYSRHVDALIRSMEGIELRLSQSVA